MQNNKRAWTEEDKSFLLDSYGVKTMEYIKKKLRRSENAIQLKFYELIGTKDLTLAGGLLSPPQVAEALGVDRATVTIWIRKYGLKASQLYKSKNREDVSYNFYLEPQDVWNWVAEHKDRVNFARVQRNIILPEPKWLQEEISKSQYMKPPKNWSEEENRQAYVWWQNGINYREIAKRLNRPERGTQRRLTALRKLYQKPHTKTKKENC